MRVRVVAARRVHDFGYGFVCHELEGGKWYRHTQRSGVRDVECAYSLGAEHLSGALGNRLVDGTVHLHALFYDCELQQAAGVVATRFLPSKGFISASLEIVAAAPLAAVSGQ